MTSKADGMEQDLLRKYQASKYNKRYMKAVSKSKESDSDSDLDWVGEEEQKVPTVEGDIVSLNF